MNWEFEYEEIDVFNQITIKDFRTKKFRAMVENVMKSRGHNSKLKYNFNLRGETKPIRINGTPSKNCVAFYRVERIERVKSNRDIEVCKLRLEHPCYDAFDEDSKKMMLEDMMYRETTHSTPYGITLIDLLNHNKSIEYLIT